MTARSWFDSQLGELNTNLIIMGSLVEDAIQNSIDALMNKDSNKAEQIIANDTKVDDMEKIIERQALNLLMRQQPVASDLRTISTALKIITDMERIGDQAADIAEISLYFKDKSFISLADHLPAMSDIVVTMVRNSIKAFITMDLNLAKNTIDMDDQVDELFVEVCSDLKNHITLDKPDVTQAIDIVMIAKYLERIADHAVNICEWVEFNKTGIHKDKKIL